MSNFPDCANPILEKMADSPYAKWGAFTDPAAKVIADVAREVRCEPAIIAVTLLNENSFVLRPMPNCNGAPENVDKWDCGPMATNHYWVRKAVEKKLIEPFDEAKVFGTLIANNPQPFDGDVYSNVLTGTRFLLAYHGDTETKVVHYVGPDHQNYRRQSWREWAPLFTTFFQQYKPDSV